MIGFNWGWIKCCISCFSQLVLRFQSKMTTKNTTKIKYSNVQNVQVFSVILFSQLLRICWFLESYSRLITFQAKVNDFSWNEPAGNRSSKHKQKISLKNWPHPSAANFCMDRMECTFLLLSLETFFSGWLFWLEGEKWIFLRFKFINAAVSKESDKKQQQNVGSLCACSSLPLNKTLHLG